MVVKIIANDKGQPVGKLADAELHFSDGVFEGLKLIGFSIWERRGGGGRNVTFPARQYSVNGERRSFALLRPIADTNAQGRIRELVLEAYAEYEEQARDEVA
jgi:hypothetical protein